MQARRERRSSFPTLLWREWREERLFLLAMAVCLAVPPGLVPGTENESAFYSLRMLVVIACGLALGVRAYAPDAANGTRRFVMALPVSDTDVLMAKLLVRMAAVGVGTLGGSLCSSALGLWSPTQGAWALLACLVGIPAGQVLDRSSTAFAAGGVVVLLQCCIPWSPSHASWATFQGGWSIALLPISAMLLFAVSRWIAVQR
jgi:hypothetical protein